MGHGQPSEAESALRAPRRRIANRLLAVLAVTAAMQGGAWVLFDDAVTAGVMTALAYALFLLLAAVWTLLPPDILPWRCQTFQGNVGAAPDRLVAITAVGSILDIQLVHAWLGAQDVALATRFLIVLAPALLMVVVVELRRRLVWPTASAPSDREG